MTLLEDRVLVISEREQPELWQFDWTAGAFVLVADLGEHSNDPFNRKWAVSRGGECIVSAYLDLRIWRLSPAPTSAVIDESNLGVSGLGGSLTLSHDATIAVSSWGPRWECSLVSVSTASGRVLGRAPIDDQPLCLAAGAAGGRQLVVHSSAHGWMEDGDLLVVRDAESLAEVASASLSHPVMRLSIEGETVAALEATGFSSRRIEILHLPALDPIAAWDSEDGVQALSFGRNGTALVLGGRRVVVSTVPTGNRLFAEDPEPTHTDVEFVAFSPDGTLFAALGAFGLRIYAVPRDDSLQDR